MRPAALLGPPFAWMALVALAVMADLAAAPGGRGLVAVLPRFLAGGAILGVGAGMVAVHVARGRIASARDEIEALLAHGATAEEACRDLLRVAGREAVLRLGAAAVAGVVPGALLAVPVLDADPVAAFSRSAAALAVLFGFVAAGARALPRRVLRRSFGPELRFRDGAAPPPG